jgi:hypothetical protein
MGLENKLIKKPHLKQEYSQDQLKEVLQCMDQESGHMYFLENFFYIQHPTRGQLVFDPFSYQTRLIDTYHNYRFNINMLPRQTGKTTCAGGYLLWYGMFIPDQTILIAAHKFTGAQEIMNRVRYAYELCPDHIRAGVVEYNKTSIVFDNGSRIVAQTTTETTGRGMAISLLYCDEFAFVPPNIAQSFWTSISPTLATGGRAIITSTPNSDEDTFATIWHDANKCIDENGNDTILGVNSFKSFTCHWSEHPDRDDQWAKEETGRIGVEHFRREYGCEFLVFDETLVSSLKLVNMKGVDPVLNMGTVRWYSKLSPKYSYIVALDPSMGTGGDNAAIQIIEVPTYKQVGEWGNNQTPIPGQIRILRDICNYIAEETKKDGSNIYWSVENNSLGEAALIVIEDFGEETIPGLFLSEPMRKGHVRKFRKGFNTTHNSKVSACSKLKTFIENDKLKVNSRALISELKDFIAKGASFQAKTGRTDDLVSAMLLIIRMLTVMKDWDPNIYATFVQTSAEDHYDVKPMPMFITMTR